MLRTLPVLLLSTCFLPVAASGQDAAVFELPTIDVSSARDGEAAGRDGASPLPARSPGPALDPATGVIAHTQGPAQIGNLPGGTSATIGTVLQRLPGVVQDSYGEVHIRGEHGNAQYRVNGFMLPPGLEGFGQGINTHFVHSASLLTGTLPAAYGLNTAGVIEVATRSGAGLEGAEAGVYAGSFGTVRPYYSVGGTRGALEYFGNFTFTRNNMGIENPAGTVHALHDRTTQYNGFGGMSYRIDEDRRVQLLFGVASQQFQIPNTPGLAPRFTLEGQPLIPSEALNETQNERRYFAVLGYEQRFGNLTVRPSLFYSHDRILFTPDPVGDLQYQGLAGRTLNRLSSAGPQLNATYAAGDRHTIGFGTRLSYDSYDRRDRTLVFPADGGGDQASSVPVRLDGRDRRDGYTASFYVQDSWKLLPALMVNYGLRYDRYQGYTGRDQVSPRLNASYAFTPELSVHAGYARYFTPPGLQFITPGTASRFAGTTNAPSVPVQDAPYAERSHYLDAGVLKTWGPLSLSLDGFAKFSRGGIDLGQFGSAVILVPFNYDTGRTLGAELALRYAEGPWDAGLAFSYVRARAKRITSNQTAFGADELAYIAGHTITLDHGQPFTVAINGARSFNGGDTKVFGDFLLGSGLRFGFANGQQLNPHYVFNTGIEQRVPVERGGLKAFKLRLDVLNILDQRAKLRDGSGVGIAAAQYLPRRGVFGTVAASF